MPTIYHDPPSVSIYDNIHSTFFYNQNDNNVQKWQTNAATWHKTLFVPNVTY